MSEVDSQLPMAVRKAMAVTEEKFPELSKRHCSDRQGTFCEKTGRPCKLESCPKIKEELEKYL